MSGTFRTRYPSERGSIRELRKLDEYCVQVSGHRPPAKDTLRSEVAIICDLAAATLPPNETTPWHLWKKNYDLIRQEIEHTIDGFEDYNARVRQTDGFVLPNGVRERRWDTHSGRAHFSSNHAPKWALAADQFLLGTLRSHDQFNTTIYGQDDRYRGILVGEEY